MTSLNAMRLASLVTAINVLVASVFSIAAIFRPEAVVPAGSIPTEASLLLAMYAAARTIPLALFALARSDRKRTPRRHRRSIEMTHFGPSNLLSIGLAFILLC